MDPNSVQAQRAMVTGEEFYEAKKRGARSHELTGNHRTKPREAVIASWKIKSTSSSYWQQLDPCAAEMQADGATKFVRGP